MGLAISIAVAAFILPALAATGSPIPPASGLLVTPTSYATGGQNNDCQLFGVDLTKYTQFRISNPQTGSYAGQLLDGTPFKIALNVVGLGQRKDKFFDFTITDPTGGPSPAAASDVGVKGGTETARYNYTAALGRPVTADTALHATVDSKNNLYNLSNVTFCLGVPVASISGTVFNDANNNGVNDSEGAPGWTVNVYRDSGTTPYATQASGSTGFYTFSGLPSASSYRVCIVAPSATGPWTQTIPTSSATICNGSSESAKGYGFAPLGGGQSNVDFGNVILANVSGTLFNDKNKDALNNLGDTPLGGWTVDLYSGAGTFLVAKMTDTLGGYQFENRPIGAYKLCIAPSSGNWRQTLPATGSTCSGTAGGVSGGASELARGYAFTLSGNTTGVDFGNVQVASISGAVFNDVDFSGSNNVGDTPRSGRTVKLYSGGSEVATATSVADGSYQFADKDVGPYTICLGSTAGEGETLPTANPDTLGSVDCGTPLAGNFFRGYGVTLSGDTLGLDFGTTAAIGLCTAPFGVPGYEIHLALPCKLDQLFVVSYSDTDGRKLASVRPIRTDLPPIPMVEKITWSLSADGHQFKLVYDDTLPYGVTSTGAGDLAPKDMLFCKLDPRDPSAATYPDFTLRPPYNTVSSSGSGAVLPGTETSCLISSTTTVLSGKYVAYVYSAIDGWRSTP